MSLAERTAIVTGAGQGIGEASALRFAEDGWGVACVDIVGERVRRTAQRIESQGGRAIAVVADISTAEGNRRMVEDTIREFGGLDALHANAAIQIMGSLEETTPEEWDRLHAVNLRGVYLGIKEAIPELRKRGGGSIVVTASLLGIVGDPQLAAYGAMKGGLRSLCRSVATGYGQDNIRINTICPGDVETPLLEEFFTYQSDPEEARKEDHRPLPAQTLCVDPRRRERRGVPRIGRGELHQGNRRRRGRRIAGADLLTGRRQGELPPA